MARHPLIGNAWSMMIAQWTLYAPMENAAAQVGLLAFLALGSWALFGFFGRFLGNFSFSRVFVLWCYKLR